jgi:murein DD-endopeptidase MepM/ murein hydrolase activator NlpD
MRAFERRRLERLGRQASVAGLAFAVGALADTVLTWRLHRFEPLAPTSVIATPQPLPTSGIGPIAGGETVDVASDIEALERLDLLLPVDNVDAEDLLDTFDDRRGVARTHEAIDIMAARHTPVRAVADGTIAKLYLSEGGGGVTVYQFDPSRTYSFYYAHLDRYASGLREGQAVTRGQVIGYVGSTGNASEDAPHLHFAIYRLNAERQWWKGDPINPYLVLR